MVKVPKYRVPKGMTLDMLAQINRGQNAFGAMMLGITCDTWIQQSGGKVCAAVCLRNLGGPGGVLCWLPGL